MKKSLIAILLTTLLTPVYTLNANSENINNSLENHDCKIEKKLKMTFKVSGANINEKLMNSLSSLISKRLNYINVCYEKIDWKDDNITIILQEFTAPEKIARFLSDKAELNLKTQVIDPVTKQVKTEADEFHPVWQNTNFDKRMIVDAKLVEKEIPEKKFLVTFNLDEKGLGALTDLEKRMKYQYFVVDVDNDKIGAILVEENQKDAITILNPDVAVLYRSSNNSLVLKNLSAKTVEKLNNKNVKLKFNEVVSDPVTKRVLINKDKSLVTNDSKLTSDMISGLKVEAEKIKAKDVQLSFTFNEQGSKVLKEITEKFKDKPFALEINNEIVSAPVINEVITGGSFVLTGRLTEEFINDIINNKAKIKFKEPVIDKTDKQIYRDNKQLWTDSKLTVAMITEIAPRTMDDYKNNIRITLNEEGKKVFSALTKSLVKKPIGIEVNGEIISSPIINEEISSGEFDISIPATEKEAKEFAAQIKSEQPEATMKLIEIQSL